MFGKPFWNGTEVSTLFKAAVHGQLLFVWFKTKTINKVDNLILHCPWFAWWNHFFLYLVAYFLGICSCKDLSSSLESPPTLVEDLTCLLIAFYPNPTLFQVIVFLHSLLFVYWIRLLLADFRYALKVPAPNF